RNEPPRHGGLHVWTEADGLRAVPDRAELHNGMAWTADETRFLLSHSQQGAIWDYPYDPGTGRLGSGRLFARIPPADGIPDGATIDDAGGYWCALHGGGRLRRFGPDGTADRDVVLPVSQPTMCCFGGSDLDELFVTSATDKLDAAQRAHEPLAGSLFRFRPGVRGRPGDAVERPRRS
ncbi:MAG: SMP-30/gluconolactonase/LRE family protein, partial [Gluconacetobacter diazotrophicus]|nr:SMP-30/gluconolactonase/LRE family protein [Gluconacetobacter diazotrophicus]